MLAFSPFCLLSKDITDLFGADLPVEGGKGGEFAWRDGPLLAALKAGHWVVLDEVRELSVLPSIGSQWEKQSYFYIARAYLTFHITRSCCFASTDKFLMKKSPPRFLWRIRKVTCQKAYLETLAYTSH